MSVLFRLSEPSTIEKVTPPMRIRQSNLLVLACLVSFVCWTGQIAAEQDAARPPEITVEPIVIEAERINETMTREQMRKKFEEVLGTKPQEILSERWVSNDTVLVTTHGRKYCVKFVPSQFRSGIEPPSSVAGACLNY
jgi:hypothetical protein